jgi:hypothetical protein
MKSNTKVFLQNRFGHENTVRKTILSILKKWKK